MGWALVVQMVSLLVETPSPDMWNGSQQQTVVHTVDTPAPQVWEELVEGTHVVRKLRKLRPRRIVEREGTGRLQVEAA